MENNRITYIGFPGTKNSVQPLLLSTAESKLVAEKIIYVVSRFYSLTDIQLKARTRVRDIVWARHLSMFLIRQKTNLSLKQIGKLFSRDHTSVIHAIANVNNLLSVNNEDELQHDYKNIRIML